MNGTNIFIGCAGWSIPRDSRSTFTDSGSQLERYASRFSAVEINSSFYRPHRITTYSRWAASVPSAFRFAVKFPKVITHEQRLSNSGERLAAFLDEVGGLDAQLGCLLLQLPPTLKFDQTSVTVFLEELRRQTSAGVVCEPRHASWFTPQANTLLQAFRVSRVAADPAPVQAASVPAGSDQIVYYRMHGSPRMYYSTYSKEAINVLATRVMSASNSSEQVWCIFDNTADGAAVLNALELLHQLEQQHE